MASRKNDTKFTRKDWVTISLASLSLALSLATASAIFLQSDDLRIVLDDNEPLVTQNSDTYELQLHYDQHMTVINAGNRQAAIMYAVMKVAQIKKSKSTSTPTCDDDNAEYFQFSFEPFTVKPGEIALKKLVPLAKTKSINVLEDTAGFVTCLQLSVVTPDTFIDLVRNSLSIPLVYQNADTLMVEGYYNRGKPISIRQRLQFVIPSW